MDLIRQLHVRVLVQVGQELVNAVPAPDAQGLHSPDGPVEGAQAVRLLANKEILRGAGHKGKGD